MAEPSPSPSSAPSSLPSLAAAEREAVEFAAELIRRDTTNHGGGDGREREAAEYVAELLAGAGLAPVVLEPAPGRANVVARMAGSDPSAGALLVHGHLDVVPADPGAWSVHPFSGEVRDGVLWGRGAVDMKNADAVVIAVVRELARSGRQPVRDLVLAFTADEEDTASYGARWLADKHRDLFEGCTEAIGESGGFAFHAGPGVRLYPIAAGERGTAWLKLTARGTPGHGSRPRSDNAVTRISEAIARISGYEWPVRLTPMVRSALSSIAAAVDAGPPDGSGFDGVGVADVVRRLGRASALVVNTMRNSASPTMLRAGYKVNVIPEQAVAFVDGRMLAGYEEEFRATIDELTGPDVEWEYAHREIPLEVPFDAAIVRRMAAALLAEDPGGSVVPYCMSGGTDAKQFSRLGIACYGFTPLILPEGYDYHAMFHGTDERIPVSALHSAVRVMDQFLAG
ncbi:MAG TPA: M20/M25/M40 family metallo-hydrolase [Streptosporangiaceae bacterium]